MILSIKYVLHEYEDLSVLPRNSPPTHTENPHKKQTEQCVPLIPVLGRQRKTEAKGYLE